MKTHKMILKKEFFLQNAIDVAPQLLGKILCRQCSNGDIKKGIIVETESYTQDDPACHAYRGKTNSNKSLFLVGGHCYVYLIYGIYYCLNTVTGKENEGQGVLIRALEFIPSLNQNINLPANIASGPGKVCRYLHINKQQDGLILHPKNGLWIENNLENKNFSICVTTRIGLSIGKEKKERFFIEGDPAVSHPI